MGTCDKETALLLHLLKDIYQEPKIECPTLNDINIVKLLRLSARNNFGYYVSQLLLNTRKNQLPKEIIPKLETINEQGEYVIFKTYRGYSRIPSDVDVLVPNLSDAAQKLKSAGPKISRNDKHEVMLIFKEKIKIHLQDEISWAASFFFDKELVFSRPQKISLWNTTVKIPNINIDLLSHVAHINFEPLHFTLSDFIYICKIIPFADLEVIRQAQKYNWLHSFSRTLSLISAYHRAIYASPFPFDLLDVTIQNGKDETLDFPKNLPRTDIALAFLEKRPFLYLLSKLTKSLEVIATGDTYQAYYNPPELKLINEVLENM
jgi:hypothetical protein